MLSLSDIFIQRFSWLGAICLQIAFVEIIIDLKDLVLFDLMVIYITVVFFLATGRKGRFLYDLVRSGSQPALGRLLAIAGGMNIVFLTVSVVVPKPFDPGTTRPISCSGHLVPLFGTPCTIF